MMHLHLIIGDTAYVYIHFLFCYKVEFLKLQQT